MNPTKAGKTAVLACVATLALCTAGCTITNDGAGPIEHWAESVDLKGAQSVQLDVEMGAGELEMRGGASQLMDADFRYRSARSKPDVSYNVSGSRGMLEIRQPSHSSIGSNSKNEWDLRLNEDVPMDVHVKMGAGEGRLSLGTVALHSVQVEMGAGELKLDLTGHPRNDVDVRVSGGVGEATVHLPRRARLDVQAHGGLGEINVRGMTKQGDHWVNEPSDAQGSMHVNVSGGIGGINLICE